MTLEYLSKTILSGVRPYESEIISSLLKTENIDIDDLKKIIEKNYGVTADEDDIQGAISVLEGNFVQTESEKAKYSPLDIIKEKNATIERGVLYREIEKNEEYMKQFCDIINVALARYKEKHSKTNNSKEKFILYEKYSRRDVSLLVNAGKDISSVMYGKYLNKDDLFLFVTYHKESVKDSDKEYLDGKPDYSDRFEDNSIFLWESQIGKGIESSYMADVKKARFKHLLIKKSDNETDFYYMGCFDITEMKNDKKRDNNGILRDITKVKMKMHNSVRDDLLRYFASPIEEDYENSQSSCGSN